MIMNRLHSFQTQIALVFGMALFAASAQGQILKCTGPKGEVEFSNQSCQKGWKRQELALKENTVNHSGSREQSLLIENERLKAQLEKAQAVQPAPPAAAAPVLTEADLQAQRLRAPACEDAARRYEIAAGSVAPRPELIAARRSAMFAACGIPEPDSVNLSTQTQVNVEATRPCLQWGWRIVQSRSTTRFEYVRSCIAWGFR